MKSCLKVLKLVIEKKIAPDKQSVVTKELEIQKHLNLCENCRSFIETLRK